MKTKKFLIILSMCAFFLCLNGRAIALAPSEVANNIGVVASGSLNVRSGPSTAYRVVTTIYKDEKVKIFAKINNWYVVQTSNDYVGAVSSEYINFENIDIQSNKKQEGLTNEEQEIFNLVNKERLKAGIKPLKIDKDLQKIAKQKAEDMVKNDYFAHNSKFFGSPFDMMKKARIKYRTAGENLAGNLSGANAVKAWINSQGHKQNMISNHYNYTGIAVVESPKYGHIYVQMFIGK